MLVEYTSALANKADLYASGVVKQTSIVQGELIATPKWVEYDAVTVKYGPGRYDFSIIEKSRIIRVEGEQIDLAVKEKPKFKTYNVTGSKGDQYTVTIGQHNNCTCHAFQFRRSCKHIKQVLEAA